MFDQNFNARNAARQASTITSAIDGYRVESSTWFDGSLASVDARLAKTDRILHAVRQTNPFDQRTLGELTAQRTSLAEFRGSMLNAHQDREFTACADCNGECDEHKHSSVDVRAFVRENADAMHVASEMRERAFRHAALRVSDHAAHHFADDCVRLATQVPRPRTAAVLPTTILDFPDHLLFS